MDLNKQQFFRLTDIIGDPKATPPKRALFPVGKSTWWAGVKSGAYPQPIKLGERVTVWKKADIVKLINEGPLIKFELCTAPAVIRKQREAKRMRELGNVNESEPEEDLVRVTAR